MSRYTDTTPSSHVLAFPSFRYRSDQYPQQRQQWADQQAGPSSMPWLAYGPPPSVPTSLYDTSHSAGSQSQQPAWDREQTPPKAMSEGPEHRRYSKGRDYLRSLGEDMAAMQIGISTDRAESKPSELHHQLQKPLPDLPHAPVLLHRPRTDPGDAGLGSQRHSGSTVLREPLPLNAVPYDGHQSECTLPKSFKPSPYLQLPELHRPRSDSILRVSVSSGSSLAVASEHARSANHDRVPTPPPSRPRQRPIQTHDQVIDLTYSPASSASSSSPCLQVQNITPRSPARVRKAQLSPTPAASAVERERTTNSPSRPSHTSRDKNRDAKAVQCAGYTRAGQPCKRLVRAEAPYLATLDQNIIISAQNGNQEGNKGKNADGDEVAGRYCKDHSGMICSAPGFYTRDKPGTWVTFQDWLPPELGSQTQTVLRMTMESKLTAKETPGFIYVYELRDLQTARTSWFKVGRTDNVPRRIGQWTNQCISKSPTLRDIFPLSPSRSAAVIEGTEWSSPLHRNVTLTKSLLPGAVSSGTLANSARTPSAASKRWERLIHLELADLAARTRPEEWGSEEVRGRCADCGVVHREIFPVPRFDGDGEQADQRRGGDGSYQVVMEIICRWERFVQFAYVH